VKAAAATMNPKSLNVIGMTYVALLRGINLLGHRRISMPALEGIFATSGAKNVRSYIQSGNIIFSTPAGSLKKIAAHVEREVNRGHGFQCIFTTRSAAEMAAILAANPFKGRTEDGAKLHVAFLADAPAPERIAVVDGSFRERSPGDDLRVIGREVYLHLPNGMAGSKLRNDYLDSRLKTMSTTRNWNTVNKLAEMMAE
jgi:uncharacterized protein (DUF1697 family)